MSKPKKQYFIVIATSIVGAISGWLYWRYVGCIGGTCPIWSNPWIATGYGALLGWLIGGFIPSGKKQKESSDVSNENEYKA